MIDMKVEKIMNDMMQIEANGLMYTIRNETKNYKITKITMIAEHKENKRIWKCELTQPCEEVIEGREDRSERSQYSESNEDINDVDAKLGSKERKRVIVKKKITLETIDRILKEADLQLLGVLIDKILNGMGIYTS